MPLRSVTANDPIGAYFGDDYGGAQAGIAVEPGHGAPTFFGGGRRRRDRWPRGGPRAPAGGVGPSRPPARPGAPRGAGWDVRGYEQAGPRSEVGAGIQLAPNCTRILRGFGVLPAVERVAVRPTTFEFRRWDDGRLLSATPLGDAIERSYGAPYLHAHRADLVAVLAAAVPAECVEGGRRGVGGGHTDGPPQIRFADGSSEVADLVVGADAIHSAVRGAL